LNEWFLAALIIVYVATVLKIDADMEE